MLFVSRLNRAPRHKNCLPSETLIVVPLLFLYPRWFASVTNTIDESRGQSLPVQARDPTQSSQKLPNINLTYRAPIPAVRQSIVKPPPKNNSKHNTTESRPAPLSLRKDDIAETISRRRIRVRRITSEKHYGDKGDSTLIILSKQGALIADRNEDTADADIAEETVVDEQKVAKNKIFNPKNVDWLPIANMLAQICTEEDYSKGKILSLSERLIYEYTGDVKPNMWIHKVGTGCEVHVLPRDSAEPDIRKVVLHGSPRAMELTAAYLHHLEDKIRSPGTDQEEPKNELGTRLPAFTSLNTPTGLTLPFVWSVRSFYRQVSRLVDRKVRRSFQKAVSNQSHNATIAAQLKLYFSDRLVSQHVSVLALNRALKFVCDHSELAATQDFLHTHAKKLGLRLNVQSYSMILVAALKVSNVTKVRSLLLEMRTSHIPPDGVTWATVFAAVSSEQGRQALLEQMKKANVDLDSQTVRAMARVLINDKFQVIQDSKSALDSVVEEMDGLFGPEWLDSTICNRMLHLCSKREQWNLAVAVLQLRLDRQLKIDEKGIVYLASMSRRKGSVEGGVSMLKTALRENQTKHNRLVIPQIFRSAWDNQCYNLCRLLWRYAASHGIITYEMQNLVSMSLAKNTTKQQSNTQVWKAQAGKVIVGIDLDTTHFDSHFPLLSKSATQSPISWLDQYTTLDGMREEQRSLAYVLLHRDLTAWKHFEPMSDMALNKMLDKALKMDSEWHARRKHGFLPTATTLHSEALDVPLVRRQNLVGRTDLEYSQPLLATAS